MSDVTRILSQLEQGDPQVAEKLLPLVYGELRKLAAVKLAQEKPGQTLNATALVHEAYLRLTKDGDSQWDSRGHFFSAAAESMRRILVENARRKASLKRGGEPKRVELDESLRLDLSRPESLLDLDQALARLAEEDQVKAELVKLRCFAGLSHQEAAAALGLSRATADRYWAYVKAWLYCVLLEKDEEDIF